MKKPVKAKSAKKAVKQKEGSGQIILLPDEGAPLIYTDIALKQGSLRDPEGKSGLASLAVSLMLRGTSTKGAAEFHRALDNLGAELHVGKFKESLRFYGVVLQQNLGPFLDLVEEMIVAPRFDAEDFAKIQQQFRSALLDELGSDDEIAERRFQEYMLWGNPYGTITAGSIKSLESITLDDVRAFHKKYFLSGDMIFAATGGFSEKEMRKRAEAFLKAVPEGTSGAHETAAPAFPSGRNLLLLDKPGRTQSQLYIGAAGIAFDDPDYTALALANHVFGGGSFSARLMKEVREKRGWSYGAYSWFRAGKKPLYFGMHAVPSNKDTVPALKLMVELFEEFSKKGISKEEFAFAKKSLLNQSAFLQDTLRKRLDNKVTQEILGLPKDYYDAYSSRLKALSYAKVQNAVRRKMNPKNLFLLVLGTSAALEKDLEELPKLRKVFRRSFDADPGDLWS